MGVQTPLVFHFFSIFRFFSFSFVDFDDFLLKSQIFRPVAAMWLDKCEGRISRPMSTLDFGDFGRKSITL
jgi:hypothetical protein